MEPAAWDWDQQGTIEWWVQPRPAAQIWRNQGWQTPFIPLHGAIDALRVQAESVTNRLVKE